MNHRSIIPTIVLGGILYVLTTIHLAAEFPFESLRPELAGATAEFNRLYAEWLAGDAAKRNTMRERLIELAARSWQTEAAVEIAMEGRRSELEIHMPAKTEAIPLRVLRTFDLSGPWRTPTGFKRIKGKGRETHWIQNEDDETVGLPSPHAWVIRRMDEKHLEIWNPFHGWLLDQQGCVLNEAAVPRRDGYGREWFGAFLPDGRWATTDLWEMDCQLAVFSKDGDCERELRANKLLPEASKRDLIGWCRSDRDGRGWVVCIGSEGGQFVWTDPRGKAHKLDEIEPWALCQPRDLEPKGMFTMLHVPDDGRKHMLNRYEPAHGTFVGYPEFTIDNLSLQRSPVSSRDASLWLSPIVPGPTRRLRGAEEFGFWPHSTNWYVVSKWNPVDDSDKLPSVSHEETWFLNEKGEFCGWVNALRIGDAEDGKSMLFATADQHVIRISPHFKMLTSIRFEKTPELTLKPIKLYADLRLGFFEDEGNPLLAAW